MANPKKKTDLKKLKGVRLYNFLLRELGEVTRKDPKQKPLSIDAKRKIVSQNLYPTYKQQEKLSIRSIRQNIKDKVTVGGSFPVVRTPKTKINVKKLKGLSLYNFLLREIGEINRQNPDQQQIGVEAKRKLVKEVLFPKYKDQKISLRSIRKDIRDNLIQKLPPKEVCHPLYLAEAYLTQIEYFEIDNHIRNVLPDCLDIRVNAGSLGKTKIFNTNGYSYYSDGVRKIVEKIREKLAENDSGLAYFDGIPKVKYRKPNNGKIENYFVDYILYINDEPEADDEPIEFDLPKKEQKKSKEIKGFLSKRFANLQKEKQKRKRRAKKLAPKSPKEQRKLVTKEIRTAINALKRLLKAKQITQAQFEKQKAALMGLKTKKP